MKVTVTIKSLVTTASSLGIRGGIRLCVGVDRRIWLVSATPPVLSRRCNIDILIMLKNRRI